MDKFWVAWVCTQTRAESKNTGLSTDPCHPVCSCHREAASGCAARYKSPVARIIAGREWFMRRKLADNFKRVRDRMHAACQRSGRQFADVRLVAVTKTVEMD